MAGGFTLYIIFPFPMKALPLDPLLPPVTSAGYGSDRPIALPSDVAHPPGKIREAGLSSWGS